MNETLIKKVRPKFQVKPNKKYKMTDTKRTFACSGHDY